MAAREAPAVRRKPNRQRIHSLERELLAERQADFECPSCQATEYTEWKAWRGGEQKDNSGEWYHYWACPNGHDVTLLVSPVDQRRG